MRVVSWNMNKRKKGCWEWLLENHSPDFVMAQEASPLPKGMIATVRTTTKKSNRTAFFSKQKKHRHVKMEHDEGMGILVCEYENIYFINVYANLDFKPVNPRLLGYICKFVSNLRHRHNAANILIAGDFNMDRRMDENPTSSVFAKKGTFPHNDFFNTIQDMGFQDCVRIFIKDPIQTHYHSRSKFPWELDHMFATKELFDSLTNIVVPQTKNLSDHNPIIADFDFKQI